MSWDQLLAESVASVSGARFPPCPGTANAPLRAVAESFLAAVDQMCPELAQENGQ